MQVYSSLWTSISVSLIICTPILLQHRRVEIRQLFCFSLFHFSILNGKKKVGKIKGPHGPLCNNIATAVLLCALTNAAKVTVPFAYEFACKKSTRKSGLEPPYPTSTKWFLTNQDIFPLSLLYKSKRPHPHFFSADFVFLLLVPIHINITLPLTLF